MLKPSKLRHISLFKWLINRFASKDALVVEATPEWFDGEWYLRQYPDVADAGVDPWVHYSRFGREEKRLPASNRALVMGHALWRGAHEVMLPRLEALVADQNASLHEQQQARWELARWYVWQQDWLATVDVLTPISEPFVFLQNEAGPLLLLTEALSRLLRLHRAKRPEWAEQLRQVISLLEEGWPTQANTLLAQMNAKLALEGSGADSARLQLLNRLFIQHDLSVLTLRDSTIPLGLDNLQYCSVSAVARQGAINESSVPLVSVIIPVYNAARTLPTVLRSLYAQTWPRLELLLVDDASTDDSLAVIASLQDECPSHIHQKLLRHEMNKGAYAARNTALALVKGSFITVHDSDDWSHPQKLEYQVSVLLRQSSVIACLSSWVRVTDELLFHRWRLDDLGWVYPNISSLMFRRDVVDKIGYWDSVRVNADTEYRERIEAAFGKQAVVEVLPDVPLALGRADAGSLSQHSSTHLITQFTGVRYAYMQASRAWHARAQCIADLYLSQHPVTRPFVAPEGLLCNAQDNSVNDTTEISARDLTRISGWFDPEWYLQRYIALQQTMIDPFEHFWDTAISLGYDPGPNFSSSGYLRICPQASNSENPLWHFLQDSDRSLALPVWQGSVYTPSRPTIMLLGHQAGPRLFGAERSLLDLVDAYECLGVNVVVTLPEALNFKYEQTLLERCMALAVLPYGWWQKGRQPVEATVNHFSDLIKRFNVSAVHANTLVLDEPLRAARQCQVPAIIHVRELPVADPVLCETLGCDAAGIIEHAASLADLLIANSNHTRHELQQSLQAEAYHNKPVYVVPNTVETDTLLPIPVLCSASISSPLRVGMLSSNLPKKGLADVEALASLLLQAGTDIELVLVGPETQALRALLQRQADSCSVANITYYGYVDDPSAVLAEIDVVINLSHFQESFGRTVLEAMAAARPVIAYDWGALSELVVQGETGYMAPLGDIKAVFDYLEKLASSPEHLCELGEAGRERAMRYFSKQATAQALGHALKLVYLRPSPLFTV